jgi:peptide-methionine (S)-S-oxide reductase
MKRLLAGAISTLSFSMMLSTGPAACARAEVDAKTFPDASRDLTLDAGAGPQTLVLAGGCFWCVEGVFEAQPGVIDVVSGYAGGERETAKYDLVGTGRTRHAEAVQITYDPDVTSYGKLLKVFFSIAHDPTQLNRQGPDVGTQYRSTIFYSDDAQREVAQAYISQLDNAKVFGKAIVTTLEPLEAFYVAEAYHQDYARLNPDQPYVRQQSLPKIDKARAYAKTLTEARPATQATTAPATRSAE